MCSSCKVYLKGLKLESRCWSCDTTTIHVVACSYFSVAFVVFCSEFSVFSATIRSRFHESTKNSKYFQCRVFFYCNCCITSSGSSVFSAHRQTVACGIPNTPSPTENSPLKVKAGLQSFVSFADSASDFRYSALWLVSVISPTNHVRETHQQNSSYPISTTTHRVLQLHALLKTILLIKMTIKGIIKNNLNQHRGK